VSTSFLVRICCALAALCFSLSTHELLTALFYLLCPRPPLIDMLVCVSGPPGRRLTAENPLYHKSRIVTRNFRQIFGGQIKNCGKISGCGFWASKFSRNFRPPTISTSKTTDRLKRRKPPYQLMAALLVVIVGGP
jgi:hypothetical protein